jgi:hypothetical protein
MKGTPVVAALAVTATFIASSGTSGSPSELIERIAGRWVLEGTIAGKTTGGA